MSDKDETQDTDGANSENAAGDGKDWQAEADKWKALARKHEQQSKANAEAAQRLAAIEDEQKSEGEKFAERLAAAEKRATAAEAKALRFEVAAAKGVPANLVRFLTGDTEEDLAKAADDLLAAVKGDDAKSDTDGAGNDGDDDHMAPPGRPQERLKAGAANDAEPEEMDPAKLAASIPRP